MKPPGGSVHWDWALSEHPGLCSSAPVENHQSGGGAQWEAGGSSPHTCSDMVSSSGPVGSDGSGSSNLDPGSEAYDPIALRRACWLLKVSRAGPTCRAQESASGNDVAPNK